ncbi:MAG: hypothetical protein ACUVQG_09400 [Thermogutta sp.]
MVARLMIQRLFSANVVHATFFAIVFALSFGRNDFLHAGGGPENLLLVVNRQSVASLTIGNHYQALRQIPAENVLYLDWDPKEQITDVDRFREKILVPIFEEMTRRGLIARIESIVYSADFPWGIELRKDIESFVREYPDLLPQKSATEKDGQKVQEMPAERWPKVLTPRGSITGLTYLAGGVLAKRPDYYMSLRVNQYMRRAIPEQKDAPTLGFRSDLRFGQHGEISAQGDRYWLSTVLGVVADEDTRGNTLEEIIEYLTRSTLADASFPPGTIYFVQNGDIRSRTRDSAYPEVVEALQALGVRAEVVHGVMPQQKPDCQGVMMGTASFNWAKSGSTILPGAICDHLTSLGGVMTSGAGQTPLTEFLRYGAAAASGTVTEPFAIAEKFPLPTIHLHYARGCSLAEAFYQSVYGPYQLLIVGDPLCRPWANIPRVSLLGIPEAETVQGKLQLKAEVNFPRAGLPAPLGGGTVEYLEWFVDGRYLGRSAPEEAFTLDTENLDDGYHELRVVAVEKGLIATRGGCVQSLMTNNNGGKIEAYLPTEKVTYGQSLVLQVESPGAFALVVRHNGRIVARGTGQRAKLTLDSRLLGTGPVCLQAIALNRGARGKNVISRPIRIVIEQGT